MENNMLAVFLLFAGIVGLCSLFRLQGAARYVTLALVIACAYGFLALGHLMA
jgi:hypothetical protein